jgi:hypothetical protein
MSCHLLLFVLDLQNRTLLAHHLLFYFRLYLLFHLFFFLHFGFISYHLGRLALRLLNSKSFDRERFW